MTINLGFCLCFLFYQDDILMIHRRFPPNEGLWNGVGGHIEHGETPVAAVIREVAEETCYQISDPTFAGLLTWEGYEAPPGGIAIFTDQVPHRQFSNNYEGVLAWKPASWVCRSPEVVDNIHVFLPMILAGEPPLHYHFVYNGDQRIKDEINPMPVDFNLDAPCFPIFG